MRTPSFADQGLPISTIRLVDRCFASVNESAGFGYILWDQ